MKIGTILFPVRDGHIYLAKKKRGLGEGFLNGYGGKQQLEDNSIEETAVRELQEEAGVAVSVNNLEKVALVDFFKGEEPFFRCHVFFLNDWEGEFVESEEMSAPQTFPIDNPPFDQMWDADRVWLKLVCEGKRIKGVSKYNEDMSKQVSFTHEPL